MVLGEVVDGAVVLQPEGRFVEHHDPGTCVGRL